MLTHIQRLATHGIMGTHIRRTPRTTGTARTGNTGLLALEHTSRCLNPTLCPGSGATSGTTCLHGRRAGTSWYTRLNARMGVPTEAYISVCPSWWHRRNLLGLGLNGFDTAGTCIIYHTTWECTSRLHTITMLRRYQPLQTTEHHSCQPPKCIESCCPCCSFTTSRMPGKN